jgi:hypothetical protein
MLFYSFQMLIGILIINLLFLLIIDRVILSSDALILLFSQPDSFRQGHSLRYIVIGIFYDSKAKNRVSCDI